MSQENVDLLTRLFAVAGGLDKQALLAALPRMIEETCDPGIEWALAALEARRGDR